jgi:hypothetical protein
MSEIHLAFFWSAGQGSFCCHFEEDFTHPENGWSELHSITGKVRIPLKFGNSVVGCVAVVKL